MLATQASVGPTRVGCYFLIVIATAGAGGFYRSTGLLVGIVARSLDNRSGFEQVQASGGAPGRGGVNPLGFSPALLRGGEGRLGRSLDPILLYSQARSVHSRANDPDTLHFQGSPRLEQGLCRSASCQPVARPSTATAPTRYSRREAWLRSDVIRALLARAVPCFPAVLYVYRFCRCDCRGGGGCSRAECRR